MQTIHNPVNFVPTDYAIFDYFDNRPPQFFGGYMAEFNVGGFDREMEIYRAALADWQAEAARIFPEGNMHQCQHCGQRNVRYVVAVDHLPTGKRVCFGDICVDRLGFANHDAFRAEKIRSAASTALAKERFAAQKGAFLNEHPELIPAFAKIISTPTVNSFALDIYAKFNQYGSISDRQIECLLGSLSRDEKREASRQAEKSAVTGTAESGRYEVKGEIVSAKMHGDAYSQFGAVAKMLIKRADGVKFWVSVPSNVDESLEALKGMRIAITATWEQSEKDAAFAFGKRPAKATVTPALVINCRERSRPMQIAA